MFFCSMMSVACANIIKASIGNKYSELVRAKNFAYTANGFLPDLKPTILEISHREYIATASLPSAQIGLEQKTKYRSTKLDLKLDE